MWPDQRHRGCLGWQETCLPQSQALSLVRKVMGTQWGHSECLGQELGHKSSTRLFLISLVVQLLSCVWLLVTPWTVAWEASLSFTISQSLLKLMSMELEMLSNHWPPCECSQIGTGPYHTPWWQTVILGSFISYLYIRHTVPLPYLIPGLELHEGWGYVVYLGICSIWSSAWHVVDTW